MLELSSLLSSLDLSSSMNTDGNFYTDILVGKIMLLWSYSLQSLPKSVNLNLFLDYIIGFLSFGWRI